MAIYRLLQKSAFDPVDIKVLTEAYELARVQLDLKDRDDPLTEHLAKLIIEVAQMGEAGLTRFARAP
ncbi:MAG: hypothetical protein K2Y71_13210 [Xanthobacteraceae bacterium]|nr:hypothetical protein [Xanthobacteraceae bacterium]